MIWHTDGGDFFCNISSFAATAASEIVFDPPLVVYCKRFISSTPREQTQPGEPLGGCSFGPQGEFLKAQKDARTAIFFKCVSSLPIKIPVYLHSKQVTVIRMFIILPAIIPICL